MQILANGLRLEVEEHGSATGEPLLLIMGLGMQLLGWHEGLVAQLVERGFRVIRFDNRDIGLSQSFDAAGVPNLALDSLRHALGLTVKSPYTLADMAADSVGVLDALGIARAHVCGASMGGMIAQHLAARAPERVKSLTLMMTSSGARRLPGPTLKVRSAMISRPADPQTVPKHRRALRQALCADRQPGVSLAARLPARSLHDLGAALVPAGRDRAPDGGDRRRRRSHAAARRRFARRRRSSTASPIRSCRRPPAATSRPRSARAEIDLIDGMGHDLPAAALAALRRRHRQRGRARLSRARKRRSWPTPRLVAAMRRSPGPFAGRDIRPLAGAGRARIATILSASTSARLPCAAPRPLPCRPS